MVSNFCARLAVKRPSDPKVAEPKKSQEKNAEPRSENQHVEQQYAEGQHQQDFDNHHDDTAGGDGQQEIAAAHGRG